MQSLITLSICASSALAGEDNLRIKGYVKTLATLTDFTGLDVQFEGSGRDEEPKFEGSSINTFRLNLFWKPHTSATAEFAYELIPRVQDRDGAESFFTIRAANPLSYRVGDLGEEVYSSGENSDFQLFHNLDRAFVTLSPDFGDIYIGRQPVAFGSARVVNPTDILTSFTYTELNNEERIGVDALRIKVPVGTMNELDAGVVFGEDFSSKESAAFLRLKYYLFETDISPLAILFKQNLLMGIDIARSVGDAGFWFEGAYAFANITDDYDQSQDYGRISTGLDYSFSEKMYAYIEYHFNGAGKSSADDYSELLVNGSSEVAYREGAVYLIGKNYLAPGFSFQITPLLTLDAGVLYNMNDSSVLLFPVVHYSLSDDASIEAGALAGLGRGNRIVRNTDTGALHIATDSEFGLYPDTYFISAILYF